MINTVCFACMTWDLGFICMYSGAGCCAFDQRMIPLDRIPLSISNQCLRKTVSDFSPTEWVSVGIGMHAPVSLLVKICRFLVTRSFVFFHIILHILGYEPDGQALRKRVCTKCHPITFLRREFAVGMVERGEQGRGFQPAGILE